MESWMIETRALKKYYRLGENCCESAGRCGLRSAGESNLLQLSGSQGAERAPLLHMIGGLDVPTKGEIFVDGRNITNLNKEQLAIFRRRKVGFVFQNYNLVPDLNVYEGI